VSTQEHVSETLRRAVSGGRVGHAYLFCGPRGVGKTTLARVLAMALNCPERTDEGEPCGVCDSCSRIWAGHTALDVIEIDAASNRGVDDARDLRERAMYAPSSEGRYKIYIVDEAHMLTREAWNALLKILEEPPPRVIFVFATTEPQKIQQSAAPILSRCQRFDFRRIGVTDIMRQLGKVLEREGAAANEDALRMIARKADGGMRDGLSLLDQVISLTGGDVEADSVRRVLGLVEEERYLDLIDILSQDRHAEVFDLVERLVDDGYDLVEFYHGLLDTLRLLLRLRLAPNTDTDLRPDLRDQFVARSQLFESGDLVRMLAAAAELESQGSLRRSPNPRVLIEMLLLRLSYLDRTVALEELISALGGAPAPGSGSAAGGGGRGGPSNASGGAPSAPSQDSQEGLGLAGKDSDSVSAVPVVEVAPGSSPGADTVVAPTNGVGHSSVASAAGTEIPSDDIVPSSSVTEAWGRWLDAGRDIPTGLSAFLRSASLKEGPGGVVEVSLLPGPAAERLEQTSVQDVVCRGLAPYLGRTATLAVVVSTAPATGDARVTKDEVREDTLKALYRQEPRLERAVQELDLELME
jgi:DNA polymerase III subunit gamma/tau